MKKSYILMVLWAFLTSLNASSLPKLNSLLSTADTAKATIFLDFDGQTVISSVWNNGSPLVCASSGMNDIQITEIFNRVSEDYRPFHINITTDSAIFLLAPLTQRIRIIVTPTSGWYTGVGGVSYTGSFTWGDDTPGFVFTDRLANIPKYIAECCTHESGHTVGLSHQSLYSNTCALVATYHAGVGTGEIGWAPVMGNSYYKNLTGWNNGPTPNGCNAAQDNLSIITTQNGFTYRTDDYSDDPNNNPALVTITNKSFSKSGIITTPSDKDVFKFDFAVNGKLHLDAIPYSVGANLDGADLDIKITLLNAAKQIIGTYDSTTLLNALIDTTLNAGTYYISLQGTGNVNTTNSNYGSLGSYTISGTFDNTSALPIREVALTGKADKSKHNLSWKIVADEPIKTIVVQSSTDGRFFTNLATLDPKEYSFTYAPNINADIFYRLKVTSVINQTVYSNIITLKSAGITEELFKVSTFVHNEIVVNATENYRYQLADIHGKVITTGSSNAGSNRINTSNLPNGIYVIQLITNNKRQTERIIKQ
jgi:hypothetical protein